MNMFDICVYKPKIINPVTRPSDNDKRVKEKS